MNTLRELFTGLAIVLAILVAVTLIVVGLGAIMPPREDRQSQIETNFRAACTEVKGHTVWNGRHWECIK